MDQISSDEGNRKAIADYAKTQAPVKVDLSALERASPGAAPAEFTPVAPEPGASLDAFDGKYHKCEGVGHRQSECTSRPEVQLACNKCGGWTPCPAVVGVGDCEIVLTRTFFSFPKKYPKLRAIDSRYDLLSAMSL